MTLTVCRIKNRSRKSRKKRNSSKFNNISSSNNINISNKHPSTMIYPKYKIKITTVNQMPLKISPPLLMKWMTL